MEKALAGIAEWNSSNRKWDLASHYGKAALLDDILGLGDPNGQAMTFF